MKSSNEGTFPGLKSDRLYEDIQDEQVRITRDHMAAMTYSVGSCQYIPIKARAVSASARIDLL